MRLSLFNILGLLTLLWFSVLQAQILDAGIYPPPVGGTYDYNTFKPGAAGFPALGGTYVDPVFGSTIRRITNIGAKVGDDDSYSHNWSNANGTYLFYTGDAMPALSILNTTTGALAYSGQPFGTSRYEINWHPTDPNKYFYLSGSNLMERNLTTQTSATLRTFPGALQLMGGSLNWVDRTGDLFVVMYGGTAKVWKRSTNSLYTGSVTPLNGGGWVSITPDGNYLVTAAGPSAPPNIEHHSYQINHATTSIGGTPTQFWGLCGDHGVLVSATNGKNYFITFDCNDKPGLYRVDITLNQAGKTYAQQQAANQKLVTLSFGPPTNTNDGHLTSVQVCPNANWVFFDSESFSTDGFNGSTSNWVAYKSEIMVMNVLTLEVRRLAHHRSRGINAPSVGYYTQPRISVSGDGSVVSWASNMNISSPVGYADIYGINNPLGPIVSIPKSKAPTNLRIL